MMPDPMNYDQMLEYLREKKSNIERIVPELQLRLEELEAEIGGDAAHRRKPLKDAIETSIDAFRKNVSLTPDEETKDETGCEGCGMLVDMRVFSKSSDDMNCLINSWSEYRTKLKNLPKLAPDGTTPPMDELQLNLKLD